MSILRKYIFILIGLISVGVVQNSFAVNETSLLGNQEQPIKIGLLESDPYVIKGKNQYEGIMVDYWREIAEKNKWVYTFDTKSKDYSQLINRIENGELDIALGDFATNAVLHEKVDFSRPLIMDYVSIITQPTSQSIWVGLFSGFRMLLPVLVLVFSVFFISSIAFWWLQKYRQGDYKVSDSVFNTAIAMINGGFVDTPEGALNRFNFIGILITGTVLQSVFFASMAHSNIQAHQQEDPFQSIESLKNKTFVISDDSPYIVDLKPLGINLKKVEGLPKDAMNYYVKHKNSYAGVINLHTENVQFLRAHPNNNLIISNLNIRNEAIAMMIHKSFPLKRSIDKTILNLQDTGESVVICSDYIHDDAHLCYL